MTLTLYDRTQAITVSVTPAQALALLPDLPSGIGVRVRPDDPPYRAYRVLSTSVQSTCTEPQPQAQPPGYFGLAVALARRTWAEDTADRCGTLQAEYQAYLRGERPDPRD